MEWIIFFCDVDINNNNQIQKIAISTTLGHREVPKYDYKIFIEVIFSLCSTSFYPYTLIHGQIGAGSLSNYAVILTV